MRVWEKCAGVDVEGDTETGNCLNILFKIEFGMERRKPDAQSWNMRRSVFFLTLFLSVDAFLFGKEPRRFHGDDIPVPPRQNETWKPERGTVPDSWLDAAGKLFELGFADPRGCNYRGVELIVSGGGVYKTHAWVLPRKAGATTDFAIGWNGLIYPVAVIGDEADVAKDAAAAAADSESYIGPAFGEIGNRHGGGTGTLSPASGYEIKIPLLLRLGERKLAQQLVESRIAGPWSSSAFAERRSRVDGDKPRIAKDYDPFRRWAETWFWCHFNRAVTSHVAGEDAMSLVALKEIERFRKPFTDEVRRRYGKNAVTDEHSAFLHWLDPTFARLLADQQRRAANPKKPLDLAAVKAMPQPERIAALIAHLDDVRVYQWDQPGSLEPARNDKIVGALIAEGNAALEPILAAWENDGDNLTRSVGYHRDFFYSRYPMSVRGAAFDAICAILGVSGNELGVRNGRDLPSPETIRLYVEKYASVSLEERWFRQLADDKADQNTWANAASELVSPANQSHAGRNTIAISPLKPGEKKRMKGEPLRSRENPSVSELLARRFSSSVPAEFVNKGDDVGRACGFAVNFGKWDAAAAQRPVREFLQRCLREAAHDSPYNPYARQDVESYLPGMVRVCAAAGQFGALEDYCKWLESGTSKEGGVYSDRDWPDRRIVRLFKPLWLFPDQPASKRAVVKLFDLEGSPLALLLGKWEQHGNLNSELIKTPMPRWPQYRAHILSGLKDRTVAGQMTLTKDGQRKTETTMGGGPKPQPGAQYDTPVDYRVCDQCAVLLSAWKGFPIMEPTWPEAKRDEILAECEKLIREKPGIFDQKSPSENGEWPSDRDEW